MKRLLTFATALWMVVVCESFAQADIIVTVQDTTISAGGTGTLDVLISGNAADHLAFASYDFNIAPVGGPLSTLAFTNPQDLTEDADPLANYVFYGQGSGILETTLTNSQFAANDAQDGSGLEYVPLTGTFLLARLDLTHLLGLGQTPAQAAGEQFQITLDTASLETLFQDEFNNVLAISNTSKLSGIITVAGSPAAVPEPGTLAVLAIAAAGWGGARLRRGRKLRAPLGS